MPDDFTGAIMGDLNSRRGRIQGMDNKGGNTVVKAAYVGKLAHNLVRMTQQNPAAYIPGASTVANTDQRRILMPGTYGSFRLVETNSNAAYHSLQLTVNKRLSHGFTVLGAYTLGKMLDYYSAMNLGQTPQEQAAEVIDERAY